MSALADTKLRWVGAFSADRELWATIDALAELSCPRSIASRSLWIEPWLDHFADASATDPSRSVTLGLVEAADGALVGATAVAVASVHGLRIAQLAGTGAPAPDHLTAAVDDRTGNDASAALVEALLDLDADLLDLDGLDPCTAFGRRLYEAARERGGTVDQRALTYVRRPATWEDYLAGVSRNRRSQLRRRERAAAEAGLTIGLVNDAEAVRATITTMAGWNATHHAASTFADRRMGAFHVDVATRLAAAGLLRLTAVTAPGGLAAVSYCYRLGGETHFYNTGSDPALADLHVGEVAIAASLRQAIEEGSEVFDLLRGDEGYKARFATTTRPNLRLRIPLNRRGRTALRAVSLRRQLTGWRDGRSGDRPVDATAQRS